LNNPNIRRSRPQGGGAHFGGNRRPTRSRNGQRGQQYINPTKFVNKAVTPKEEVAYASTHKFVDFPLNHILQDNIASRGYSAPSAIQDQAIPHVLAGKDVIGLANTGTGKTAAFVIPMIERIQYADKQYASALIITPTRELATQIDEEFRNFSKNMKLYSTVVVGGMSMDKQIRDLNRRPHVIIGTPGRIKDLINRRALRLQGIQMLVLDEADRMLDMGFVNDINYIIEHVPAERQSLCFSATITPAIDRLFHEMLKDPVTVSVRTSETSEHVEQDVIQANSKEHKIELLTDMLSDQEYDKVLVFGQTKFGVQRLSDALNQAGHASEAIHGNKSQPQRQRALNKFRNNEVKVLVATDVAARGLDIPNVSHVINFDQPNTYDDYIHRIGRTGRGGNSGKAFTFVDR
jgi:ATP-dependent RNA helicase RhlE